LGMTLTNPTRLLIDNQGALDLIRNGQINDRTKHIDTKFRHICDREEADDIASEHVATDHQIADIMTKALGTEGLGLQNERDVRRGGVLRIFMVSIFSSHILISDYQFSDNSDDFFA